MDVVNVWADVTGYEVYYKMCVEVFVQSVLHKHTNTHTLTHTTMHYICRQSQVCAFLQQNSHCLAVAVIGC
jgi:hypothetical protein